MAGEQTPVKAGYRTTEFWLVGVPGLLVTVAQSLMGWGLVLPGWAGPAMAGLYAISRGLAKKTT